ncbi:MAG TPA: glycosyltransferase [Pirellulales bacterium]|nr:glycosyltransferase [Pirellulales bacterium]
MNRPWLSVIMPTYNGADFIGQALESVVRQDDGTTEVIAVDDGSTDATRRILAAYSGRVTVIERRHSGNWVESTALGMSAARGEYLCWLHQDDVWRPRRLARLRRLAAEHPDADLIVHPSWYIDASGRRIGYWRCPLPRVNRTLGHAEVTQRLLVQCFVASPATVFRAEAVKQIGLPDARLTYSADWDYWLRLAQLGRTVYHPTPLSCFRIHAGSQTIAQVGEADQRREQERSVVERHLPALAARCAAGRLVGRVARFSVELNHALACALAGRRVEWRSLAADFSRLGMSGWHRLFRDSRVVERCLSRAQAVGVRPSLAWQARLARDLLFAAPHALPP